MMPKRWCGSRSWTGSSLTVEATRSPMMSAECRALPVNVMVSFAGRGHVSTLPWLRVERNDNQKLGQMGRPPVFSRFRLCLDSDATLTQGRCQTGTAILDGWPTRKESRPNSWRPLLPSQEPDGRETDLSGKCAARPRPSLGDQPPKGGAIAVANRPHPHRPASRHMGSAGMSPLK
jgi:hypothetical protein